MSLKIYLFLQFHLSRLFRNHPILFFSLAGSLMVCVFGLIVLVQMRLSQKTADDERHELLQKIQQVDTEKKRKVATSTPPLDLPLFESAEFVDTINNIATDSQITLEEVSYVLEDGVNQPFLRYKLTFTVFTRYPVVKNLLSQLRNRAPHVLLDTISCSREDILLDDLGCDLVFSAYFKKR